MKKEKDYTNLIMGIIFSVFIVLLICGIGESSYMNYSDDYDETEAKICNYMKGYAKQYGKITAVDYQEKFYKDECIVYVDKKAYNAHEFMRLVGLEEISLLDDALDKEGEGK